MLVKQKPGIGLRCRIVASAGSPSECGFFWIVEMLDEIWRAADDARTLRLIQIATTRIVASLKAEGKKRGGSLAFGANGSTT